MAKAIKHTSIDLPGEKIIKQIYIIRGQKVMLDFDLAALYEVEMGCLKLQVRRNINRFPEDFLFELSNEEYNSLRSQFGISSWGSRRYLPMAFTEQGLALLSGSYTAWENLPDNKVDTELHEEKWLMRKRTGFKPKWNI